MKIHRFLVPREKFLYLPEPEKLLLIYTGHVLNELSVLNRLLLYAEKTAADSKVEKEARMTQLLVLLRIVVGKLWESWVCIQKIYLSTVLPKVYNRHLSAEGASALGALKRHFGKKSTLNLIRHKVSFHYSVDETRSWLSNYPRKTPLQFNLAHHNGNSVYTYSEEIVMNAALDLIDSKSSKRAIVKILNESLLVNKAFQEFLPNLILILIKKYFGTNLKRLKARKMKISNFGLLEKVKLPYFVISAKRK